MQKHVQEAVTDCVLLQLARRTVWAGVRDSGAHASLKILIVVT